MDPFIWQIQLFPYDYAPAGWLRCEGQLLSINQNQALFSVLNIKFGGDGHTTFALPNMRGKEPIPNMCYCVATISSDIGTGVDPYIGQIQLFPYDSAPAEWLPCEGQLLRISQNQALYALINVKFGGNGSTTFALPDMRGKEPIPNMRYCIAVSGIYPARG